MSEFSLAIPTILRHEGGYTDNSDDPGGATNYGVSLRWLRSQGLLEELEREEGDLHQSDVQAIKNMTQAEAEGFYRIQWWNRYGYGRLLDQPIATKIFDTAVNMGPVRAHKIAQEAAGATVDGQLGSGSILALNSSSEAPLLHRLQVLQAGVYRQLALNPKLAQFLPGWLNRAYDKN
jgi:lysozyme family protein